MIGRRFSTQKRNGFACFAQYQRLLLGAMKRKHRAPLEKPEEIMRKDGYTAVLVISRDDRELDTAGSTPETKIHSWELTVDIINKHASDKFDLLRHWFSCTNEALCAKKQRDVHFLENRRNYTQLYKRKKNMETANSRFKKRKMNDV